MGIIAKIEDLVGRTVETLFTSKESVQPIDIDRMARKALAQSKKKLLDKTFVANSFEILLGPAVFADTSLLHAEIAAQLRGSLIAFIAETGYATIGDVEVKLLAGNGMARHEVRIIACMTEHEPTALGAKLFGRLSIEKEQRTIYVFRGTRLIMGSDPACDVVINDGQVSKRHAEIVMGKKRVSITDLGSRHGTAVNGKKIYAAGIAGGYILSFGGVVRYKIETTMRNDTFSSIKLSSGGTAFLLMQDDLLIGSRDSNQTRFDLALDDDTVTGRQGHALLSFDGDKPVITDLGSTNGTRVNGEKITRTELNAGDAICLGDAKIIFSA